MENADHAPEKAEGLSGTRPSLNPQDSRLAVDEREYLFSADAFVPGKFYGHMNRPHNGWEL